MVYHIQVYDNKKKKKGNYGLMIREEKTRTTPQRKKRVLKITQVLFASHDLL